MLQNDFKITTGETQNDLPTLPTGNPIFTITIETLPSWNDLLSAKDRGERIKIIKNERERGYRVGLALGKKLKIPLKVIRVNSKSIRGSFIDRLKYPVTDRRLFCILKIWRRRSKSNSRRPDRKRDVYNPAIKAIIDGLTDAGVWIDDNEDYHTDFWIHYAGLSDNPRMEIKFYYRD